MLERILSRDNLLVAWKRVKANKGKPGVDGVTIDDFPAYLREALAIDQRQATGRKL